MYGTDQNYCLHEDYFEKIIVCQNYLINVIICVSIKDKIDEKSQYFFFHLIYSFLDWWKEKEVEGNKNYIQLS